MTSNEKSKLLPGATKDLGYTVQCAASDPSTKTLISLTVASWQRGAMQKKKNSRLSENCRKIFLSENFHQKMQHSRLDKRTLILGEIKKQNRKFEQTSNLLCRKYATALPTVLTHDAADLQNGLIDFVRNF